MREKICGLVKFVLFTMDDQRHNQVKIKFFALILYYLHPEIAKTLSKFTMSEIINYFIEVVAIDEGTRREFKSLCESS